MDFGAFALDGPRTPRSAPIELAMLVVEQHALVRTALRTLLDATGGMRVVAEAGDWNVALEMASTHDPDVVLMHERIWDATSRTAKHALRRTAPDACVLLLTHGDGSGKPATEFGADGLVRNDAGLAELCDTVASVLGSRCRNCVLKPHCPAPRVAVALSRREEQVAIRVANGLTSKQIAAELGIGLRTVHTYRESLSQKLGASSAAVVTRFVLESGLDGMEPGRRETFNPAPSFRLR